METKHIYITHDHVSGEEVYVSEGEDCGSLAIKSGDKTIHLWADTLFSILPLIGIELPKPKPQEIQDTSKKKKKLYREEEEDDE